MSHSITARRAKGLVYRASHARKTGPYWERTFRLYMLDDDGETILLEMGEEEAKLLRDRLVVHYPLPRPAKRKRT